MKKDEKIRQDAPSRDNPPAPDKRSLGQRAFDIFLYPVVTNVGVFAVSVWATYMSTKKPSLNPSTLEKVMQSRNTWLEKHLNKMGISGNRAKEFRTVAFSFMDGSLMAPVVKLFEDRRNDIARSIDEQYSKEPVDPAVYEQEPKQSWTSVLGGRAATAAIVVPTAIALDKTKFRQLGGQSLNDVMFNNPGEKLAKWVEKKPNIQKMFQSIPGCKNVQVGELARVSLFEAFYTSVCTAGLYFTSRAIARSLDSKQNPPSYNASFSNEAPALTQELEEEKQEQKKPKAKVSTHHAEHAAPEHHHAQIA